MLLENETTVEILMAQPTLYRAVKGEYIEKKIHPHTRGKIKFGPSLHVRAEE
jgi:hypothetical protein